MAYIERTYSVEALEGVRGERPRDRMKFYLSPSVAGYCARKLYLLLTGQAEDEADLRLRHIFRDGEIHEEAYAALLRAAGVEVLGEQVPADVAELPEVSPSEFVESGRCLICGEAVFENALHGHMDFLVVNPETARPEVIDHKAVSTAHFEKVLRNARDRARDELFRNVKPYLVQLGLYMVTLSGAGSLVLPDSGRVVFDDLDEVGGALIYKNKNNGAQMEVRFRYVRSEDRLELNEVAVRGADSGDPERVERIFLGYAIPGFHRKVSTRLARVREAAEGRLDARELPADSWQCAYCRVREACERVFLGAVYRSAREHSEIEPDEELRRLMAEDHRLAMEILRLENLREAVRERLRRACERLPEGGVYVAKVPEGRLILTVGRRTSRSVDLSRLPPEELEQVLELNREYGFIRETVSYYPVVRLVRENRGDSPRKSKRNTASLRLVRGATNPGS
ncbi:PD-(D/E)XK nuclease family protein [Thermosulfurimonas sp. F29]|uniref:PD-(D/E)XK nuclease family protein n=1 Tax=Thermosulfurimonas sp. F29 TaxID=2867247 RepID=UPI001C83DFF7|nr:PD-(D/E)XK nuclease family protein [Thermosulfurimonas sp. F29]MBX6424097.1 PD-(D/E)XK nuclease family protein [Thermosulfurimonas sp. F29]